MSIEQMARDAGARLRESAVPDADVEEGLARLHATHARRRRSRMVLSAAAAVVLVAGVGAVVGDARTDRSEPPAVQPARCLPRSWVRCLPDGRVLVDAATP